MVRIVGFHPAEQGSIPCGTTIIMALKVKAHDTTMMLKGSVMPDLIKPITPEEVGSKKKEIIPEEVIMAFNTLIAKHWSGNQAKFTQNELIDMITLNYGQSHDDVPENFRNDIFTNKWLDVEPIYEQAGWKVIYDKPAYCENYEAFFIFKKRQ